jgi:hypothetical protein
MKISRRTTLIFLLLGLCVFLGILFRSFIQANFITPLALVLWLFWRILQSVDQKIYWIFLVLLSLFFVFLRLTREPAVVERATPDDLNDTLENVRFWRTSILISNDEFVGRNVLKRDLAHRLSLIYAAQQPGMTQLGIYNDLKQRQIALPENVYAFLFPEEHPANTHSIQQFIRTPWQKMNQWVRRWTGREAADYYQSIEEVLSFMESLMEMKNDDEHFRANNH